MYRITKDQIIKILNNNSQKSVIGWAVEEEDFDDVASEIFNIIKKNLLSDTVEKSEKLKCDCCSYEYSELTLMSNGRKLCKDCS